MTVNHKPALWAKFMAAALAGTAATETEGKSFGHRAAAAQQAAALADYALAEYLRRFGADTPKEFTDRWNHHLKGSK